MEDTEFLASLYWVNTGNSVSVSTPQGRVKRSMGTANSRDTANILPDKVGFTLSCLSSVMWMLAGILPRRSSKGCILTAPLLYFPKIHAASTRLVDVVVESKAYEILSIVISNMVVFEYLERTISIRSSPSSS